MKKAFLSPKLRVALLLPTPSKLLLWGCFFMCISVYSCRDSRGLSLQGHRVTPIKTPLFYGCMHRLGFSYQTFFLSYTTENGFKTNEFAVFIDRESSSLNICFANSVGRRFCLCSVSKRCARATFAPTKKIFPTKRKNLFSYSSSRKISPCSRSNSMTHLRTRYKICAFMLRPS